MNIKQLNEKLNEVLNENFESSLGEMLDDSTYVDYRVKWSKLNSSKFEITSSGFNYGDDIVTVNKDTRKAYSICPYLYKKFEDGDTKYTFGVTNGYQEKMVAFDKYYGVDYSAETVLENICIDRLVVDDDENHDFYVLGKFKVKGEQQEVSDDVNKKVIDILQNYINLLDSKTNNDEYDYI